MHSAKPVDGDQDSHYIGVIIALLTMIILLLVAAIMFIVSRNKRSPRSDVLNSLQHNFNQDTLGLGIDKRHHMKVIFQFTLKIYTIHMKFICLLWICAVFIFPENVVNYDLEFMHFNHSSKQWNSALSPSKSVYHSDTARYFTAHKISIKLLPWILYIILKWIHVCIGMYISMCDAIFNLKYLCRLCISIRICIHTVIQHTIFQQYNYILCICGDGRWNGKGKLQKTHFTKFITENESHILYISVSVSLNAAIV